MRTTDQLRTAVARRADIRWRRFLPQDFRVFGFKFRALVYMKLELMGQRERIALAEVLARLDWYNFIGQYLNDLTEIPPMLRPIYRRLIRQAVSMILVPLEDLEPLINSVESGTLRRDELAERFDLPEDIVSGACRMYRDWGAPISWPWEGCEDPPMPA